MWRSVSNCAGKIQVTGAKTEIKGQLWKKIAKRQIISMWPLTTLDGALIYHSLSLASGEC